MKKSLFICLACLIAVQLAVPIGRIIYELNTLENGVTYRIKAAPADPYDPFHGRYVAITPEGNLFRCEPYTGSAETVYAVFAQDEQGFGYVSAMLEQPPPDTIGYVKGKVQYNGYIKLPWERYYMDEKLAPAAEKAYRERSEGQEFYILVKIKAGRSVIAKLYADGVPIEEWVRDSSTL